MLENLTNAQLEGRLDWLEHLLVTASPKELPTLNHTYQRVMDELVRRDLEFSKNPTKPVNRPR